MKVQTDLENLVPNKPWVILTKRGTLAVFDDRCPLFWTRRQAVEMSRSRGMLDTHIVERVEIIRRNRKAAR